MQTILVTGGAGFIGSHMVDRLIEEGYRVVAVDNLSTGRRENLNPRTEFYEIDTNDPALGEVMKAHSPSAVFMFAFNTDVPKSVSDPVFDAGSITGSLRTLDLARRGGVRRVVFASTSFVYGNARRFPTPEDEPVVPINPYIISKAAAEHYLEFYAATYGLQAVAFRYATTYGPRQIGGAMADYIRSIHDSGQADIYGDGSKTRDYTFIEDVIDANMLALRAPSCAGLQRFNLGTSEETTLYSLYKKLAALLGREKAEPAFQSDRPGEVMRMQLDVDKAREVLGWHPRTSLDKGLRATVDYFLANPELHAARGPGSTSPD